MIAKDIKLEWFKEKFKKYIPPEVLVVLLTLTISSLILIINPIGLGDSGEYPKILGDNGLYYLEEGNSQERVDNFTLKYGIYKYANENKSGDFVGTNILLKLSILITKGISDEFVFDIRVLSFIYILINCISSFLLIRVLSKKIKRSLYSYLLVVVYALIFLDISYLENLNSLYSEGMIYTFFLLTIGVLFNILYFKRDGLRYIIIFALCSSLFIYSKIEFYPIGILTGGMILRLANLNKEKSKKIIATITGIIFILFSFFVTAITSNENDINKFHSLTKGALLSGENPETVLEYFNIDGSYSLLKGESYYNSIPSILPTDERLKNDVYGKITMPKIMGYYITNPNIFNNSLSYVIKNAYKIREDYIGNFQKEDLKEDRKKSYRFSLYSSLKERSIFKKSFITLLFWSVSIYSIYGGLKKGKGKGNSELASGYSYIVLIAIFKIGGTLFLGGLYNIGRSMFLYNLAFDIMLLKLLSDLLVALEGNKGEKVTND